MCGRDYRWNYGLSPCISPSPRLTGSRHGVPCAVHTEPCSPGVCGQQERLVPITGKYKLNCTHYRTPGRARRETRPGLTRSVAPPFSTLHQYIDTQRTDISYRVLSRYALIKSCKVRPIFAHTTVVHAPEPSLLDEFIRGPFSCMYILPFQCQNPF